MRRDIGGRRYSLIDAVRGVAIINMLAYHLCYDIFCVFGVWPDFYRAAGTVVWERFICCTFIIVSGVSLNFSRHGYRRGLIVSLCGLAVTAATLLFLPEQAIRFGVLSLLGCAMIVTFALRNALRRINPIMGMLVFFLLFMLCYGIPRGYLGLFAHPLIRLPEAMYRWRWLAFLGFPDRGFASADYFPILPWIFLYLFGYQLWRWLERRGFDRWFLRGVPALDFIGRHSLIIYMAHQPILYGVCYLILG